ncbi:hypothetical protein B0H14DRAFT_3174690 [Mycena olivaceomarginata]|nr:hypothetical protein B0H14DRAFT_3174690 [Mycena olivaceomarginata]
MADLEVRSTDGNKMAMKRESATRDLSRWFPLIPPFSSLRHLPSFDFIPTALHWALSGPVFHPVFPVLMSCAQASTCMHIAFARGCIRCVCMQTLTACNVHGKQRTAFTVSTLSYSTFFRLAAILLLMAVASLVPTANLGTWIAPTSIQYTPLFSSQLQIGCTLSQSLEMYLSLPLQLKPRLTSTILAVPHRCHGP